MEEGDRAVLALGGLFLGAVVLGGVGLGALYVPPRPPSDYQLGKTYIEDGRGFPVEIIPGTRYDKIKASQPVTLWQYWSNASGEQMPVWSIAMLVTYPDGTLIDLIETKRAINASHTKGYAVFSAFTPTFEGIYETAPHRTYVVEVKLLIVGEVVDEATVNLIAQV